MNTGKYVVASVVAAVWMLLYGFVMNTIVLKDFWASMALSEGMMRPENEQVMWAIVVSCLAQALALGYVFIRGYENRGVGEGFRFGLLVAWFIAAVYLLFFAIQPWTLQGWVTSSVVDGGMYIGVRIVLALLYRPKAG